VKNFNHKETQKTQKEDREILPKRIFVARSVSEGDKKANAIFAAKKTKKAKRGIGWARLLPSRNK
jgi:hypothetical protein